MRRIRGLLIFYAVITVIAGVIVLGDGGGEILIVLASGVGLIISAIVDALIADLFSKLAEDKGYDGSAAFWLSFWMSGVGYLYVCAMPDKSGKVTEKTASVMNGSTPFGMDSTKTTQVPGNTETKKCICAKCGANIGNAIYCPECGSSMKTYIYD